MAGLRTLMLLLCLASVSRYCDYSKTSIINLSGTAQHCTEVDHSVSTLKLSSSAIFSVDSMTLTESLRSILSHFTKTRNVAVNPAEKQNARDYIVKTFKDHGLSTWTEEFQSNNPQYPGVNIIGQLPGRYTGSRDDKIVLIGSHYDSEDTTPGVDDNGSGMTALLQALKLYTNPGTFKSLAVKISGVEGRPSNWPRQVQFSLQDFFRSDHYRFWDADPSLPTVFLTDTADFRGYMKQCYHQSCDDINHVTPDMITFLARTTESLVGVASNITNEKCEMKQADCIQEADIVAYKGEIQEIKTPYFGTQYPNNMDCGWSIRLNTTGMKRPELTFKFTAFDLEESTNCSADYVELRDGTEKTAKLIGRYCGKTLPSIERPLSPYLYVTFHSDELGAFEGFKAEISGVKGCGQGLWQLTGVLVMVSLFIYL
ncbi:uncharacterized protein [Porites lutea]|uniref:uncharacterized protein n=1 Tax=Porites lutea TaxID=51062 RepID=UPI003CC53148